MFFILNNEKAVLAADKAFLESVGVPSVFLLAELFRSGDVLLDEENHTCQIGGVTRSFTRSTLQTTFGNGYFYLVDEVVTKPGLAIPPAVDQAPDSSETLPPSIEADTPEPAEPEADSQEQEEPPTTFTVTTPYIPDDEKPEDEAEPSGTTEDREEETAFDLSLPDIGTPESDTLDDIPSSLLDEGDLSTNDASADLPSFEEDLLDLPSIETETPTESSETKQPDPVDTQDDRTDTPENTDTEIPSQQKDEEEDLLDLLDLGEPEPTVSEPPLQTTAAEESSPEDDLLDLFDLDEASPTPPPADASQETPPAASEDQDAPLIDLLEIEKPEETSGSDLAAAGAVLTGVAAVAREITSTPDEKPTHTPEEKEIFDLLDDGEELPSETKQADKPQTTEAKEDTKDATEEPFADYQANAEIIGITSEEYHSFLKQFTEESLGYESGLRSQDLYIFKKNLTSIKDASQLLHLPRLSETINKLEDATSEERRTLIDDFFAMINHIRRDLEKPISHPEKPKAAQTPPPAEPTPAPSPAFSTDHTIPGLDAIEPIPFDFSTQAASDELGLPEALVREFVSDFVKQAEENISVFQEAQQKGDIDTIQKTAHLLKGAASNLRIDPLAETLKSLQYNEDPQKLPELFTQFVGQLKSLVNFTDLAGK